MRLRLSLLSFLLISASLQARTWTNDQGRKVEAEFSHEDGANVVIKLPDGKLFSVPLAKLSAADQAFVMSTRKPAEPPPPPPEPVPPQDEFPPFDYGAIAEPSTDAEGRSVYLWGPLKVTTPAAMERAVLEKALRPVLGGHRVLEHLGYPAVGLPGKEQPLLIALYPNEAEVAKAAGEEKAASQHFGVDGSAFATLAHYEAAAGSGTSSATGLPLAMAQHSAQALKMVLPTWFYYGSLDYAAMLPAVDGWPQHSHARIAMRSYLASVAEKRAYLVTPSLIDSLLEQPDAELGEPGDRYHAAALATVFYLRHLHDDGNGTALKSALASEAARLQATRSFFTKVAAYEAVMTRIKADPQTKQLPDGRISFSSSYEVPELPDADVEKATLKANRAAIQQSLNALLGPKPGQIIVAALKKQGFTQGIASDSGDVASSPSGAGVKPGTAVEDLTPDYSAVKPPRPHLPLAQRTWPVEIIVSASAMNPSVVSEGGVSFVYRAGRFEFRSDKRLSVPLVKEISRLFTMLEEVVERMPWDIPPTPAKGQYFVARLYSNLSDYQQVAPPSSGGFYSMREKVFHVPFQALGIDKYDSSSMRGLQIESETLIHELTHMMMDHLLGTSPIWFAEGAAEYVSIIPILNNSLRPADLEPALKAYVKEMQGLPAKAQARYSFKPSSQTMAKLLHTSYKQWHENDGTERRPMPVLQQQFPMSPQDTMAHQAEQYMHACLLFYYFMHLDSPQRGDPMLHFIDRVSDNVPQWELFTQALTEYEKRFVEYNKAFFAFSKLPGVKSLPGGRIEFPSGMTPPEPPQLPRAPVDLSKLPDEDRSLSYIDTLTKGRSEAQLAAAFKAAYAKIGITLE